MSETSDYSGAYDVFTDKEAKKDKASKADMNKVQNSIEAMQAALGLSIEGNLATLAARLANLMNANGALAQGTSFPGTTYPGLLFFRTDLNQIYIRNAADSAWVAVSATSNIQVYTTSSTFVAPSGISKVYVTMIGGGGGGSGDGGGGGGSPAIINSPFTVVAGSSYTVTVGAGGGGGAGAGAVGSAGGTSSFDSLSIVGGNGATGTSATAAVGGLDASTSTPGGRTIKGGAGGSGTTGAGGGSIFGVGAAGNGGVGVANTGAGGGGKNGGPGGAGGSGLVIVMY